MSHSVFKEGLLHDQVVVITGGGTGIGFAVAESVVALGAKVAICGRRSEVVDAAATRLRANGATVHAGTCDIRVPDSVSAFVDSVLAAFGRIDVLVNNAGGQFPSPAEHITPKGFDAVVRNNLIGTWNMTHAVATKALIPQKGGRIVNVIAQIIRGFPGMVHTGAARAGVDNITKTLSVEWAHHGIRVNAVAPGMIRTSGTDQYPVELLESGRKSTPLKRLGTAEEVAHLITYLASPAADFITGQTMYIDGGQSLWGDLWTIGDDR
ncbi:MAG: SDR family oxidoreductase [Sandaracinaceae bacterium]|nr:SDR family oxidoreductase [Sandaracinaceae bacterium]